MTFLRVIPESLAFGFLVVLLWVIIWTVAFPEVWVAHDNHIVRVFGFSSVAYILFRSWTTLSGRP